MTVIGRIMASQKGPHPENSLAIQWLGLRARTAKGSIPGQETKIPQAELPKKKKTTKKDSRICECSEALGSVNVTLHEAKDSADVIKLKILRQSNYPGLPEWTQSNPKGPDKKKTRR